MTSSPDRGRPRGARERFAAALRAVPPRPSVLRAELVLLAGLERLGWQHSVASGSPVDQTGQPVPWLTYAASRWLAGAVESSQTVVEYGGGGSTLWLADHVGTVVTVEHDEQWLRTLRDRVPANVLLLHRPEDDAGAYVAAIDAVEGEVDVVLVDGIHRVACFARGLEVVADTGGVVVLDDADRDIYAPAHQLAAERRFVRVDYFGPRPGLAGLATTSVFTRDPWRWFAATGVPERTGY